MLEYLNIKSNKDHLEHENITDEFIQIKSSSGSNSNKAGISKASMEEKTEAKNTLFTETSSRIVNFHSQNENLSFIQVKTNRGLRFLYAFALLIASSIICFLIVKSTVDWATYSKSELNRYRDARTKHIADMINNKFNYIRRAD